MAREYNTRKGNERGQLPKSLIINHPAPGRDFEAWEMCKDNSLAIVGGFAVDVSRLTPEEREQLEAQMRKDEELSRPFFRPPLKESEAEEPSEPPTLP